MEIDREQVYDRIDQLAEVVDLLEFEDEGAMEAADEFLDLCFIRDLIYLQDEGFIEIDDEGRTFPIGEAVCLHLP